jgi:hypothetical protein
VGVKAKKNFETTGSILGHVKIQEPVWRTEREEAELEERYEAQASEDR